MNKFKQLGLSTVAVILLILVILLLFGSFPLNFPIGGQGVLVLILIVILVLAVVGKL